MYVSQQAKPQQFVINPQNHVNHLNNNSPSYQMVQNQSIPVVTHHPSMYNIPIKHNTKVSNAPSSFVAIIHRPVVGPDSTIMTCPCCRALITTTVVHKAGDKTHLMALGLCLFLCWPFFWVPYCIDRCQNAHHTCPNCNAFLGTYKI